MKTTSEMKIIQPIIDDLKKQYASEDFIGVAGCPVCCRQRLHISHCKSTGKTNGACTQKSCNVAWIDI